MRNKDWYYFRFAVKWALIPALIVIGLFPEGYVLGGAMAIAVILAYVAEANHLGDTKE
jgi:hypothetical protein